MHTINMNNIFMVTDSTMQKYGATTQRIYILYVNESIFSNDTTDNMLACTF